MNWRKFREQDLLGCLNLSPVHMGAELVGTERALAAWKKLIRCRSCSTFVIEQDGIAGFGAGVFVSPAFAHEEFANPRAGVNSRVIASIDSSSIESGRSVVLSATQLSRGNSKSGLDLLLLYGHFRLPMAPAALFEARVLAAIGLIETYAGYRLNGLFCELGPTDRSFAEESGVWRVVCEFGGGRALATMTQESVAAVPGSMATTLFRYREPRLRLREEDQQLLSAALSGLTDEELSRELSLKLPAVKRRWLALFERSADIFPELDAERDDGKRGRQKRHHLLAYIREHPEELRPIEPERAWGERAGSSQN